MIFGRRKQSRRLWAFFMRPVFPFALEFLLLAPLILGMDIPEIAPFYLFFLPWLLFVLGVLNLPLLGSAFRVFKMDAQTRRNHALEHATVHFLWARGLTRTAGCAANDGFRISGGASPEQVRAAFENVRRLMEHQEPLPHVSRYCGSNRVTVLALAMVLLLVVGVVSLAAHPPLWIRAAALVGVVLLFTAMRHAIGNWVQARFFMATDFDQASVRAIRKVKAEDIEVPPAYFVETAVFFAERGAVEQADAAAERRGQGMDAARS